MSKYQNLTKEQIDFIKSPTIGALLGPAFAISSGLIKEFWLLFIPLYNFYLIIKLILKGRQMAWEANSWSFELFKKIQSTQEITGYIFLFLFIILFII